MNNVKNKKSKHLLTVALTSLIIVSSLSASVMSGCGERSVTTTETIVETGTSIVTKDIEETNATDENGKEISAVVDPDSAEDSESSNSGSGNASGNSGSDNNNSDKSESSNSNSSNKSNSSNSSNSSSNNKNSSSNSSSSSKNNSNNSSSKTLSIDGNKFSVGDTVTCVYKLTTPENLENFQAYIKYDTKYLKVKKAVTSGPAESGSVMNYNLDGQIKFNGVNISSGYNYKKEKDFVTVTYEVVSSGSTKPTFNWEVATGVSQKSYVSGGNAANGIKLTTSYS